MNVLVLNSGSSSLKFKLYNSLDESVISYGEIKNHSGESVKVFIDSKESEVSINKWESRLDLILESIESDSIDYVLHRVVHGGVIYTKPTLLDKQVVKQMKLDVYQLAPLHNPAAFEIIEHSLHKLIKAKNIAVFDSSFGIDMPEVNYLYGLPYEYYEKFKIRRFAFHGLSHKYISESYRNHIIDDEMFYSDSHSQDEGLQGIRIVSLHLGSGCSTCAIKGLDCVDTSFGFTPEENLVMSTRVGEIDYSAIRYLKKRELHSDKEIEELLNNKSGLLGLSGYSKDMKTLVADYKSNNRARLAVDVFVNNVVKQTFNMIASLNGIDVLIFTGGIGQTSDIIRTMICERLSIFGIYIDVDKSKITQEPKDIVNVTGKRSKVDIFVIPTNEEKQMLAECSDLIV